MCYFFWSNTPTADNLSFSPPLPPMRRFIFFSFVLECAFFGDWRALVVCMTQHENCESQCACQQCHIFWLCLIYSSKGVRHIYYVRARSWANSLFIDIHSLCLSEREHTPLFYFLLFSVLDIEYLHWADFPCKHVCWARVPTWNFQAAK